MKSLAEKGLTLSDEAEKTNEIDSSLKGQPPYGVALKR